MLQLGISVTHLFISGSRLQFLVCAVLHELPGVSILHQFLLLNNVLLLRIVGEAEPPGEFRGPRLKEKNDVPASTASRKFSGSRN